MSAQTVEIAVPKTGRKIQVPTGLFINNEFVPSVDSKESIECVNPATEEVICSVAAGSAADIDRAVAAARAAFKTTWGKNVTGVERSRLINKLADLIERDAQELAELETLNNGKPVRIARDFDIGDSVSCLRYYAGWADKIAGQSLEVDNKTKFAFTRHDPIGVCGQIIPWNYPINMWSWKVAPALAMGCTIVMKPSELTPLTALFMPRFAVVGDPLLPGGWPAVAQSDVVDGKLTGRRSKVRRTVLTAIVPKLLLTGSSTRVRPGGRGNCVNRARCQRNVGCSVFSLGRVMRRSRPQ